MKKLYALAAAALMGVAVSSAQSIFVVGAGDGLGWTPETPYEVEAADGAFSFEIANLTQFKISTDYGDWNQFNSGVYGCDYGEEAGVEVTLEQGWTSNIVAPWKGDWKVVVAGDLSTISMTTTTPKPAEGLPELYLRGDMNGWRADESWKLEALSKTLFKYEIPEGMEIPIHDLWKIADADWNKYNIGGNGEGFNLDSDYEVYNGGNPANLMLDETCTGVLWLGLDIEGQNWLYLSNDKEAKPEWAGGTPIVPDPVEPVVKNLYITGSGEFPSGSNWDPENPDEFVFSDGMFVIEVKDLTQFKISTEYGDWMTFNDGVYGCAYGEEPGVEVALEAGWDSNIVTPWKGDWTVKVAPDLSYIVMTTTTPKPVEGLPELYVRGDMNIWSPVEAWKMTALSNTLFKLELPEPIKNNEAWKIADADWNKYNIGGDENVIYLDSDYEVYNGGNPANLMLDETCTGVIWLGLNIEGQNWLFVSNDKNAVPEWAGLTGIETVEAADEAPVYFNLQGVRVANPGSGIYVKVAGGKVLKTVIR